VWFAPVEFSLTMHATGAISAGAVVCLSYLPFLSNRKLQQQQETTSNREQHAFTQKPRI